jgi:YjgF/chorismate_mutase-like, putative endoribonuclease
MSGEIAARMQTLGILLPEVPIPSAQFLPFRQNGTLVQLAGTISRLASGDTVDGKLGRDVSLAEGHRGARLCALNLLAALSRLCGFFMVRGFVNVVEGFTQMPRVIDGASELIISIFGDDIGRHARTAIGCASLPSGAAVEVDALVFLKAEWGVSQ